jgi:hypothetical protein
MFFSIALLIVIVFVVLRVAPRENPEDAHIHSVMIMVNAELCWRRASLSRQCTPACVMNENVSHLTK